ncbi:MAG: CbiM family transporter [Gemmatales bacterium]|nr:CbiM family transporter [Gemmatales bacterium]MDW7993900.1 CbiM family transporter [Gemmatales bacterium]
MSGNLLAVHIADGVLTPPWWLGGWVGTGILLALSSRRIEAEEIPRLALVSAACFVASSIHVPLPFTSVHLLLNNLSVLLAGRRAALAIFPALFLQALLLNHGGLLSLGINTLIYTLPAWVIWELSWPVLQRFPRLLSLQYAWLTGAMLAALTVLSTVSLNALVLYVGGIETWPALVALVFVAHLPVVGVEACISASLLTFLLRVKPTLLALPCPVPCPTQAPSP